MSKPREFWIPMDSTGQAGVVWVRDPKNYQNVPWDFIHVREIVPIDWDKVWKNYTGDDCYKEKIQQLVEKQLAGEE